MLTRLTSRSVTRRAGPVRCCAQPRGQAGPSVASRAPLCVAGPAEGPSGADFVMRWLVAGIPQRDRWKRRRFRTARLWSRRDLEKACPDSEPGLATKYR